MRALVCREFGPPESLVINELDDPSPGKNQILVDIVAAGINFPDVLVIARAAAIWREMEPDKNDIATEGLKFLKKTLS